jgi:hypothetical protein
MSEKAGDAPASLERDRAVFTRKVHEDSQDKERSRRSLVRERKTKCGVCA